MAEEEKKDLVAPPEDSLGVKYAYWVDAVLGGGVTQLPCKECKHLPQRIMGYYSLKMEDDSIRIMCKVCFERSDLQSTPRWLYQ